MTFRMRYRPVKEIRELPPRVKLVQPEDSHLPPAQRYLRQLDRALEGYSAGGRSPYQVAPHDDHDLISHVFSNQLVDQSIHAHHLADQIVQRRYLAQKHLRDIQWRLDELKPRKPLRLPAPGTGTDDGKLTDVEKQILDLERQERIIQLELWRDLVDVRKDLAEARREYRSTRSRLGYLVGGDDA